MKNFVFLIAAALAVVSCKDNGNNPAPPQAGECERVARLDQERYQNAPDDPFQFDTVYLNGDCLYAVVTYGGGCGTVEFNLYDAEAIVKTLPPKRNLRLSLLDNDNCEALRYETLSFNIANLQLADTDEVTLLLDGWNTPIRYRY